MKRVIAITLAIILAAPLPACSTASLTEASTDPSTESTTVPATDFTTEPLATDFTTEPPVTDPPATDPPVTDPPATEPLATDPPATEPPATEPPVTNPPATTAPPTEGKGCSPWCLTGEFTVIVEPTTTSTGLQVAYCEKCGKEFLDEIAKLIVPEKLRNVDPRIAIYQDVAHGYVHYSYKTLHVTDTRTWDGAPRMVITEEDYLDISYYKQDGSLVTFTLRPVEGHTNNFAILEDGSYNTGLWGDFQD